MEGTVELHNIFSLLSVIAMAVAMWSTRLRLESNIVFVLQIIGYLLLAASSWVIGAYSAVAALAMCAVTLFLKMIRKYPYQAVPVFALITLIGGLAVNNKSWVGVLPILAGVGVVVRHSYRYKEHLPLGMFPKSMWDDIRSYTWTVLPQMDNANRRPNHALDVFLENIVGVALWGSYAWLIGDMAMLYWRGFLLAVNMVNFLKRLGPLINRFLNRALPPSRSRRRSASRKKVNWTI